jgi:hypothetical protein
LAAAAGEAAITAIRTANTNFFIVQLPCYAPRVFGGDTTDLSMPGCRPTRNHGDCLRYGATDAQGINSESGAGAVGPAQALAKPMPLRDFAVAPAA